MPEPRARSSRRAAHAPAVILASGSPYRRELLSRLLPAFSTESPDLDESPLPGESAPELATRLACAKAAWVARQHRGAVVIGSDQVAELDGRLLGKPGTRPQAAAQLAAASGRTLRFHTAVCVVHQARLACRLVATVVRMRALDRALIAAYLRRERVLDCAGSFKAEGLGIALFDSLQSEDPTALIGLPLIATCELLRECGIEPLLRTA